MKRILAMFLIIGSLSQAMGQRTLHLPHFTTLGGNWSTQLAFTNSSGQERALSITAYNSEGQPAGTWDLTLPAYGGIHGSIQDICSGLTAETGSLTLLTNEPTATGLMKFTYTSTGGTSSLPLIELTGKHLALPLLENHSTMSSGFAIVNTSETDNLVKLTLRSFDGITIQSAYRELASHEKWVAMLDSTFESPIPSATYIQIEGSSELTGFALSFAPHNKQIIAVPATLTEEPELSQEDQLLNSTFRIDIQNIEANLGFYPLDGKMKGSATLDFYMLPGQNRALVHLSSHIRNGRIKTILLDGKTLSPGNQNDVQEITFPGSSQVALEFQRYLDNSKRHVLEMTYEREFQTGLEAFFTDVNDITGNGNEYFFPTINRPAELAHHQLNISVQDNQPYYMIGSGWVQETESGSKWSLDTERQIASYTLMFFLGAQDAFDFEERIIQGVPVRIMTSSPTGSTADQSFDILEGWIPLITQDIGTFPMPRGLALFITTSGGGMEYFGGSLTSNWALQHEIFHMYFACSSVAKTYRDSWWDEAITSWYEEGNNAFQAINDGFTSNLVSGRSPIAKGFDTRAYNEGARMFQHISENMGGRAAFIEFLSHINTTYRWSPFSTQDLLLVLKKYSNLDYYDFFDTWLYSGSKTNKTTEGSNPYHQLVLPAKIFQPRPGFNL